MEAIQQYFVNTKADQKIEIVGWSTDFDGGGDHAWLYASVAGKCTTIKLSVRCSMDDLKKIEDASNNVSDCDNKMNGEQ